LTREMIRLWVRNLSHRSFRALAVALETTFVAIGDLTVDVLPGPGSQLQLSPGNCRGQ
jgi:hypothetical protein